MLKLYGSREFEVVTAGRISAKERYYLGLNDTRKAVQKSLCPRQIPCVRCVCSTFVYSGFGLGRRATPLSSSTIAIGLGWCFAIHGQKYIQFHARGRLGARTVQTLETCHAKVQFEPFFVVPCSRTSSHQELHIWREDRDGQCRHRRVSRIEVLSTSSLVHRLIEACVSWVDGLPQEV